MAAMSLTQQRQTIASASTLSSAAVSDHLRQRKGKKAAAACPTTSPGPSNKEAVAAYVDMVRDKKRVQRLKELCLILFFICLDGITYNSTSTIDNDTYGKYGMVFHICVLPSSRDMVPGTGITVVHYADDAKSVEMY
jgi:hypothetical protein